MGQNSKTVYGAAGSTSLLSFDPETLVIVTDKAHPLYDERAELPLNEAMILNIMHFGVLQPIIIMRDTETGENLVVAGRQRVRHCIEANKRLAAQGLETWLIPATTRKPGEDSHMAGMMVSENQIRQGDDAMTRARKMQRLVDMGRDHGHIAILFGCDPKTVANTLSLLDCAKPVQRAVESGLIGISDVKYLARLTPAQQTAKVEEIVKGVVGKEGHARAQAKRAVLRPEKATAPKLKTRAQAEAKLKEIADCGPLDAAERKGWRDALEWLLGGAPEPEADTKTADMFAAA